MLPAALKVFVSPGTIRTCQKFLIQYNKQQLHRMLPKCKNKGKSCFFLSVGFFSYFESESELHFAEEEKEVRRAILSCSLTEGKMGIKGEESNEEQCDT